MEVKDYLVSGETFTLYDCNSCTLRFTWPVPAADKIAPYYQSENYISHTDTRSGLINKLYHLIRKYALVQKRKWVEDATERQDGELLDIGCGTGAFLNEMKNSGWTVTGLEPDQLARDFSKKEYQITPLSSEVLFRLPHNSFHAITMWHVLEHVYPLHEYLLQLTKLLSDKGVLFVAVPNYTAYDAEKYKAYWAAYDVPRHLYHFSPKAFLELITRYHFKCVKQIAMPFDAFYISLLSEKYQHGKTRYLSGFINGLRSWLQAGKAPSKSSAVLYILQKQL